MQERAEQKLGYEKGSLKWAWVNTFHSLSHRILRDNNNYRKVGLSDDYHMLTPEDSIECYKELYRDNSEFFDKIMEFEKEINVDIKTPRFSKIAKTIEKFKNMNINESYENFDEKLFNRFEIEVFSSVYTPY